ncbi:MAG TPA: fibronectin type III domain-containing protein [Planctomycetota bacterium]|nr:fibronectin type III domain-containing protein [Planctomycetota bacterium]
MKVTLFSCLTILMGSSWGSDVLAQEFYGDSCSTLSRGHAVCTRNNDAETWKGGTLPKSSRIYISVGNSSPSTISGFSLHLQSRSGRTEYVKSYIYSSSNGTATGSPDRVLAIGLMVVEPTLGWCRARVCPEVSLPAGYYFIAYDNPETSLASSISQNGVLSRYYYKPTNASLQGPLQDRFMRRMLCDGACPAIKSNAPRIRSSWTVETLGPPNSIAVFMIGASGTKIGNQNLPIPLFIINRPDCNLWTSMDILLPGVRSTSIGQATVSLPIDDPTLKDKIIHGQWFVFDAFGGKLAYSVSKAVRVKFLQTAPAAPSGVSVTNVGLTTATVSWLDNSDDEAGFHVLASTDGINYRLAGVRAPNQTSLAIGGLTKGRTNWVKVKAHNGSGSNDSPAVSFVTKDDPPAAPSNLRLIARRSRQFDIAWNDNSSNETGFHVAVSTDGSNFTRVGSSGADATTWTITQLVPATKYWIRVRAFNAYGTSTPVVITATTLNSPPTAPSNIVFSEIGTDRLRITFRDNSNNEDGFRIESRRTDLTGAMWIVRANLPANDYDTRITGLNSNKPYEFRVIAFNNGGETSSASAFVRTK